MTHPSQSETDAMNAFLACSEGDLLERREKWLQALEKIKLKPVNGNLAGGDSDHITETKGK